MNTKPKGRLMGAKFKTFSGAANRASFERMIDKDQHGGVHSFVVEEETDSWHLANGFRWRIRKTKRAQVQA